MRQSDLVRQGVDLVLKGAAQQAMDWREATRAVAGLWRDREDLDAAGEEFRAAARRQFPDIYPR